MTFEGRPETYKAARANRFGRYWSRHSRKKSKMAAAFATRVEYDPDWEPIAKACKVRMKFGFKRPKSHLKNGVRKRGSPDYVLKRPDCDNLAKLVLDALQPAVLVDDKYTGLVHVVSLTIEKEWSLDENRRPVTHKYEKSCRCLFPVVGL